MWAVKSEHMVAWDLKGTGVASQFWPQLHQLTKYREKIKQIEAYKKASERQEETML